MTGISVDYGNKDKKANKVIVEFFNANKKYELDTVTVLHDATPEYYSDDNDEILEIKAEFPYVSDPYIAYNMGKAILVRSRNQTTMQFLGTPEMYKLNVGDIVDLTYAGLGFSGKVCRVEALELQSNGLVAVSLIEYFDVYTWEVPPQEAYEEIAALPSAYAVDAPANLAFTDTNASDIDRPKLTWDEPTDYPFKEYRVDVVDSSDNNVVSKIVDTNSAELSFIPKASDYVASVSAINALGIQSNPTTLTFTVADDPVKAEEVKVGTNTLNNVFDSSGTGTTSNVALGFDDKNKLELVGGVRLEYTAYDQVQANGDLVLSFDQTQAKFFPQTSGLGWVQTVIGRGSTNTLTTGEISATHVKTGGLRLTTTQTPSSASDTGTTGQIEYDSNYIYVCVATNTWKRVAISTW
jgi:hypothetical protein